MKDSTINDANQDDLFDIDHATFNNIKVFDFFKIIYFSKFFQRINTKSKVHEIADLVKKE